MTSSSHPIGVRNSNAGILPNLIIIGALKCGTTSLHYYLGLHPEISMSRQKELYFFVMECNWNKGVDWYRSNFSGESRIHGESTPIYTAYPVYKGVAERMHGIVPGAKLIYVVRDPIDRVVSHYVHAFEMGREDKRIEDALSKLDGNRYVQLSKYFMQMEQYLPYFTKENMMVMTVEDLHGRRQQTLQRIFKFLNVDESFYSKRFLNVWHMSKYKRRKTSLGLRLEMMRAMKAIQLLPYEMRGPVEKLIYLPFSRKVERPEMDADLRHRLIDFFKEDVNRLRKYTGRTFEAWSV
ncbi:MAG: sulfotransferase domain-containing protein [Deltaproteobacteria bacterium]|nr:sulfotransferase domain-containing protein [Deltaproteobacteria bacterium]